MESNIKAMRADKNNLDNTYRFIYLCISWGYKEFLLAISLMKKKTKKLFQFIVFRWE